MRKHWATHVNETYEKLKRKYKREKKGTITRREAMKFASETWPKKKKKIMKKEKNQVKCKVLNEKTCSESLETSK